MAVDLHDRPRPVGGVALIDVDGEGVLLAPNGQGHLLNPTASLLWQCFDGEGTVGEIAADAADAFNAPIDTIGADIASLVQVLRSRGLLESLGEEAQAPADAPVEAPAEDPTADGELESLDGAPAVEEAPAAAQDEASEPLGEGLLRLDLQAALDLDGRAVLLPRWGLPDLADAERTFRRAGLRPFEPVGAVVDTRSAELVTDDGRHPLRLLVLTNPDGVTPSAAASVLRLGAQCLDRAAIGTTSVLGGLAALVAAVPRVGVRSRWEKELERDLLDALWPAA